MVNHCPSVGLDSSIYERTESENHGKNAIGEVKVAA